MIRRLFNVASVLSLLLCTAIAALWIRSHWTADEFKWGWHRGVAWAWVPKGSLEVGLFVGDCSGEPSDFYRFTHGPSPIDRAIDTFAFMDIEPTDTHVAWRWAGFAWYSIRSRTTGTLHAEAVAPFWSIAALAGALPFGWTVLQTRSRAGVLAQKRCGLCPTCGYDLRASAERCPECGSPIQLKAHA